jgi:hypothetical protein
MGCEQWAMSYEQSADSPLPIAHSFPLFPPERIDHIFHIFLEKIIYNMQGVFVGGGIKIERSPEKMATGVCNEKLLPRRGISPHSKEYSADAIKRNERRIFNGGRFRGMLEGYFIGIVSQVIESIQRGGIFIAMVCFKPVYRPAANGLIAQVYPGVERGYVYIHGICAVLAWVKIAAVSYNIAVYRVIKTVWKSRTVKGLVLMLGKWYGKIPFWAWGIIAIAGKY